MRSNRIGEGITPSDDNIHVYVEVGKQACAKPATDPLAESPFFQSARRASREHALCLRLSDFRENISEV